VQGAPHQKPKRVTREKARLISAHKPFLSHDFECHPSFASLKLNSHFCSLSVADVDRKADKIDRPSNTNTQSFYSAQASTLRIPANLPGWTISDVTDNGSELRPQMSITVHSHSRHLPTSSNRALYMPLIVLVRRSVLPPSASNRYLVKRRTDSIQCKSEQRGVLEFNS
jgi:hypothetical protein